MIYWWKKGGRAVSGQPKIGELNQKVIDTFGLSMTAGSPIFVDQTI